MLEEQGVLILSIPFLLLGKLRLDSPQQRWLFEEAKGFASDT